MTVYSIGEAETKLSEILHRVKGGETVVLLEDGAAVAEILPVQKLSQDEVLRELEEQGIITPPGKPPQDFVPLADLPGTLAWFLENRD
jgi:antitoxin (DNA-binding transcriptional repressor) of toxin-antitoxin stability system